MLQPQHAAFTVATTTEPFDAAKKGKNKEMK